MKYKLLCGVLFTLLVIGCDSKKDDSTTNVNGASSTTTAPAIPTVNFTGPSKTNTDPTYHALYAANYANAINAVFMPIQVFALMPAQQGSNQWQWIIQDGNLTITLRAQRNNDNSIGWQYIFNGTQDTNTYNNFILWQGVISADGKSGNWLFYDEDTKVLLNTLEYQTDAQGVKTATWDTKNNQGTQTIQRIIIVNYPNGSGSLDSYELVNTTMMKLLHIEWNANGSGSWQEYNYQGVLTSSGSWE